MFEIPTTDMNVKEKPLVSVIIPTHNRARLLQGALASVYAQEGVGEQFEMEVIVVDDASSDNTPEIVRRYSEVRYIRLETNRGEWAALNLGIKAAAGKHIAFLEDDDLWLPCKLRLQVPVLEANPEVGVAYSQQIVVLGNSVFVWPDTKVPSGSVFRTLLMGNFIGMRSILVRREAFEKAGYFDEGLSAYGDYDMWLRLAFHFPFTFVPALVGFYLCSIQGCYLSDIAKGSTKREFPIVLEKALAMLPDHAEDSAQLRQEALARAELILAEELEMVGEIVRIRPHLVKALGDFPWIAGKPWATSKMKRLLRQFVLASASPIEAMRAFSEDVRDAVGRCAFRERMQIRKLLGDAWWETAIILGSGSARRDREASYAAMYAFLQDPSKLGRTLVRLILRGAFAQIRSPS